MRERDRATCENINKNNEKEERTVTEFDFTKITAPREPAKRKRVTMNVSTCKKNIKDMPRDYLINIYKEKPIIPDLAPEHFDEEVACNLIGEIEHTPLDEQDEPSYSQETDYINMVLRPNANIYSNLTKVNQIRARKDSQMIAKFPDLVDTILTDVNGIIPEGFGDMGPSTLDMLTEINQIRFLVGERDETPLFSSYKEAIDHFNKGRLAEEISSQKKYLENIQNRDLNLQIVRKLLTGELTINDNCVDMIRKTDRLAKLLIDDIESLFLVSGLIFKVILPTIGSKGRALLVTDKSTFSRICSRLHNTNHCGILYTYTIMTCKYFSDGMYKSTEDIIQSCHVCSSFNLNRKDHSLKLQNTLSLNSIQNSLVILRGP